MESQERKERREKRIQTLRDCKTPTEVAFNIWTKQMDGYMSNRDIYRKPFVEWIEAYKEGIYPRNRTDYKTPSDLAEGIWKKKYLDRDDDYGLFSDLRKALAEWICKYKTSEV